MKIRLTPARVQCVEEEEWTEEDGLEELGRKQMLHHVSTEGTV